MENALRRFPPLLEELKKELTSRLKEKATE